MQNFLSFGALAGHRQAILELFVNMAAPSFLVGLLLRGCKPLNGYKSAVDVELGQFTGSY